MATVFMCFNNSYIVLFIYLYTCYGFIAQFLLYTVVWEKFMVRNIREKKIRGKKFSSMQAIDENFLTPNNSYMHILTCTLNYHLLFFLS